MEEQFIYGEILTEPIIKWAKEDNGKFMSGWECRLQTNSMEDGSEKVIDVMICYCLKKWKPVHINEFVKLSIKGKQVSQTSLSGEVIKCNVVVRK